MPQHLFHAMPRREYTEGGWIEETVSELLSMVHTIVYVGIDIAHNRSEFVDGARLSTADS